MSKLSDDIATKISSEAAESFTDAYYGALRSSRRTVAAFYVPKATLPDGKVIPLIAWNGNVFEDGLALQTMVEGLPYTSFDVQSLDCQVLNPNYAATDLSRSSRHPEKDMSILVQVSGYVRLEEPHKGPQKQFSETFVLVPNPNKASGKAPAAERRSWLIQSQNFRLVVV